MKAVNYLIRRQVKNFIKDILHHPSKLLLYIFFIAFLVFVFIDTVKSPAKQRDFKDMRLLQGIFLVLLLFLGTQNALSSLKKGSAIFSMPDVNFLFVSPVSPKAVLFYGLLKQMAGILLSFVFMAFYSGTLLDTFPITLGGVALLIIFMALFIFSVQVFSLLTYSFVHGSQKRTAAARALIYTALGLNVLVFIIIFCRNGRTAAAIYPAISSPYLEYIPLAGWFQGAVFAFIAGQMARAAAFTAVIAVFLIISIILFVKTDVDYYEDVLETAQVRFEAAEAARGRRAYTGRRNVNEKGKVRTGRTGIGKGCGANTFFYKHICEARRRSRFVFADTTTAVMLTVNLISYFIILNVSAGFTSDGAMLVSAGISIYILFFMNGLGDWTRELAKPYIYLVPEPPFKKLIWASMTTIIKPALDGVVIFAVMCAAARANPLTGLFCALLYASCGFLFTAGNVLAQRLFGSMSNRGVIMLLYIFMLIIIMAPGAVLSLAVRDAFPQLQVIVRGLPAVGWNVAVSCLVFYFCRNLLSFFSDIS
ncbi:MAG TPA: hypothetical protein DIV41_01115 [Ruminococcaceae bacterium]|jgi:hypothetical protein|nr:hypothetical protein [Oscillospiraceae bacterium]